MAGSFVNELYTKQEEEVMRTAAQFKSYDSLEQFSTQRELMSHDSSKVKYDDLAKQQSFDYVHGLVQNIKKHSTLPTTPQVDNTKVMASSYVSNLISNTMNSFHKQPEHPVVLKVGSEEIDCKII